jgi:hypothetical protein
MAALVVFNRMERAGPNKIVRLLDFANLLPSPEYFVFYGQLIFVAEDSLYIGIFQQIGFRAANITKD